jgi:phosphoenolpyruvate carboxykinase (GTP)
MADYFAHWLKLGQRDGAGGANLPKIFHVNWFRKDDDGKFLWPGFGENSRVLAWVFRRCDGEAEANQTPIGYVPTPQHLELNGLDAAKVAEALSVDLDEARAELDQTQAHLARFGDRLPTPIRAQFQALKERLS